MRTRIGIIGFALAVSGIVLISVPGLGFLVYAGGVVCSVWGLFQRPRQFAWWGLILSVIGALLRVTLAFFWLG